MVNGRALVTTTMGTTTEDANESMARIMVSLRVEIVLRNVLVILSNRDGQLDERQYIDQMCILEKFAEDYPPHSIECGAIALLYGFLDIISRTQILLFRCQSQKPFRSIGLRSLAGIDPRTLTTWENLKRAVEKIDALSDFCNEEFTLAVGRSSGDSCASFFSFFGANARECRSLMRDRAKIRVFRETVSKTMTELMQDTNETWRSFIHCFGDDPVGNESIV